ncbi:MAG TPA: prolyl oligopeptidase family serine peptidase [Verrucomicrobiae bacterium]
MILRPLILALAVLPLFADGPADNIPDKVRPVPPPGIKISDEDRADLQKSLQDLREKLDAVPTNRTPAQLADAWIYYHAVDYALRYDEFLGTNDVGIAERLLNVGHGKANELHKQQGQRREGGGIFGTGNLLVHGYVSKIDGSIQPYGLVIPDSYNLSLAPDRPYRLDAWFHGRDEKLTELKFINDRLHSPGEFTPPDTFVLHLYGRYCNANKFAGEIDLFEALADVKKRYRIDEDRIVIRGFSMGGAACWQFAVHYPGEFAAAAPGAGFAETKEFLRIFQNEPVAPPAWEQKLWHWYDCPDYAVNLFNLPTVAYSGEIDKQKQAADIMAAALARENIELTHIIGPKTAHKYHPESKIEINRRIDALAARGRDPLPRQVKFATYTLRYNKSHWITLEGLAEHWQQARIDAELSADGIHATTTNITALTFEIRPGLAPFASTPKITIDDQTISGKNISSDRSWRTSLRKRDGQWIISNPEDNDSATIRKRPGLQGPIDDAFMDSFYFVLPSKTSGHEKVDAWVKQESERAVREWRRQFRGEPRVIKDTEVTAEHVASGNLILWGEPDSNTYLAKIVNLLPIKFASDSLAVGERKFAKSNHIPLLIYPNPENPNRYIVLNSGFTFREYDYLNNARQIAKLPDYAIIDTTVPPNSRYPGKVVTAGFFNESWQLPD